MTHEIYDAKSATYAKWTAVTNKMVIHGNPFVLKIEPQILALLEDGQSLYVQELVDGTHEPTGKSAFIQGISYRWSTIEVKKRIPTNRIAEIGVSYGNNAWRMCHLLLPKECELIDPYKDVPENVLDGKEIPTDTPLNFAVALLRSMRSRITFHREKSNEAYKRFPDRHFDFIYVDGDHSYDACKEDINLWFPKLRKGGIMAGDDFHKDGVAPAVRECFKDFEVSPNGYEWLVTNG